ncbi:Hypothetical protein ABZS17H1_01072 [Kosakonia cowanii]
MPAVLALTAQFLGCALGIQDSPLSSRTVRSSTTLKCFRMKYCFYIQYF